MILIFEIERYSQLHLGYSSDIQICLTMRPNTFRTKNTFGIFKFVIFINIEIFK